MMNAHAILSMMECSEGELWMLPDNRSSYFIPQNVIMCPQKDILLGSHNSIVHHTEKPLVQGKEQLISGHDYFGN